MNLSLRLKNIMKHAKILIVSTIGTNDFSINKKNYEAYHE